MGKERKRRKELLKQYNEGFVLQVANGVDNKRYFQDLRNKINKEKLEKEQEKLLKKSQKRKFFSFSRLFKKKNGYINKN